MRSIFYVMYKSLYDEIFWEILKKFNLDFKYSMGYIIEQFALTLNLHKKFQCGLLSHNTKFHHILSSSLRWTTQADGYDRYIM
jgi:hypothetical protein